MKYFSIETVVNAYKGFQDCMTNKSWGYLALLKGCKSCIRPSVAFEVDMDVVSNFLEGIFNLSKIKKNYDSQRSLYVMFSNKWNNYFSYQGKYSPNIFDIIVWAYRRKVFHDNITKEELLQIFSEDFNIPFGVISECFNFNPKEVLFVDTLYSESDLKAKLNQIGVNVSSNNIDAKKACVIASPGEISRGPFVQTLYAGLDITDYVLILQSDYYSLYGKEEGVSFNINSEKPNILQQIFYGAPGTGKSHDVKMETETWEERGRVVRTTFHPDSDYSTFVGAYKPTTESVQRYDIYNKPMTRDGVPVMEQIITYEFVEQAFLQAYIDAWTNREEPEFLIIEEINRGNCAQIFGDLFQLLDRGDNGYSEYAIRADKDLQKYLCKAFKDVEIADYPNVKTGKELLLPSNLYIRATMNTSDQSLFPIDSAFKRRWDWKYVPIKYKNTDWVIEIGDNKYSWISFQKEVNNRIFEATNSEDKMLGDFFVSPSNGIISERLLLNKVLFYLWNDVCKDYDGDIFRTEDDRNVTFSDLYKENGTDLLISMMKHMGVSFVLNYEEEEKENDFDEDKTEKDFDEDKTEKDFDEDKTEKEDSNNKDKVYVINGEEKDEKGDVWGKGALVKRAVEIYCKNHPQYTATQIRDIWMDAGFKIPHIIETEEDKKQRLSKSKDKSGRERAKEIKLSESESLYVSTEVGSDKGRDCFGNFLSIIGSKPEWGITIKEL